MSQLPCSTLAADRQTTLQETGLSALTDARYSDWLKDRPYRNALDLSVLSMKPQMVKARLADSSKVSPPARARRCIHGAHAPPLTSGAAAASAAGAVDALLAIRLCNNRLKPLSRARENLTAW